MPEAEAAAPPPAAAAAAIDKKIKENNYNLKKNERPLTIIPLNRYTLPNEGEPLINKLDDPVILASQFDFYDNEKTGIIDIKPELKLDTIKKSIAASIKDRKIERGINESLKKLKSKEMFNKTRQNNADSLKRYGVFKEPEELWNNTGGEYQGELPIYGTPDFYSSLKKILKENFKDDYDNKITEDLRKEFNEVLNYITKDVCKEEIFSLKKNTKRAATGNLIEDKLNQISKNIIKDGKEVEYYKLLDHYIANNFNLLRSSSREAFIKEEQFEIYNPFFTLYTLNGLLLNADRKDNIKGFKDQLKYSIFHLIEKIIEKGTDPKNISRIRLANEGKMGKSKPLGALRNFQKGQRAYDVHVFLKEQKNKIIDKLLEDKEENQYDIFCGNFYIILNLCEKIIKEAEISGTDKSNRDEVPGKDQKHKPVRNHDKWWKNPYIHKWASGPSSTLFHMFYDAYLGSNQFVKRDGAGASEAGAAEAGASEAGASEAGAGWNETKYSNYKFTKNSWDPRKSLEEEDTKQGGDEANKVEGAREKLKNLIFNGEEGFKKTKDHIIENMDKNDGFKNFSDFLEIAAPAPQDAAGAAAQPTAENRRREEKKKLFHHLIEVSIILNGIKDVYNPIHFSNEGIYLKNNFIISFNDLDETGKDKTAFTQLKFLIKYYNILIKDDGKRLIEKINKNSIMDYNISNRDDLYFEGKYTYPSFKKGAKTKTGLFISLLVKTSISFTFFDFMSGFLDSGMNLWDLFIDPTEVAAPFMPAIFMLDVAAGMTLLAGSSYAASAAGVELLSSGRQQWQKKGDRAEYRRTIDRDPGNTYFNIQPREVPGEWADAGRSAFESYSEEAIEDEVKFKNTNSEGKSERQVLLDTDPKLLIERLQGEKGFKIEQSEISGITDDMKEANEKLKKKEEDLRKVMKEENETSTTSKKEPVKKAVEARADALDEVNIHKKKLVELILKKEQYTDQSGGDVKLNRSNFDPEIWKKIDEEGNYIHRKDLCSIIENIKIKIKKVDDFDIDEKVNGILNTTITIIQELSNRMTNFNIILIDEIIEFNSGIDFSDKKIDKLIKEYNQLQGSEQDEYYIKFKKVFGDFNENYQKFQGDIDKELKGKKMDDLKQLSTDDIKEQIEKENQLKKLKSLQAGGDPSKFEIITDIKTKLKTIGANINNSVILLKDLSKFKDEVDGTSGGIFSRKRKGRPSPDRPSPDRPSAAEPGADPNAPDKSKPEDKVIAEKIIRSYVDAKRKIEHSMGNKSYECNSYKHYIDDASKKKEEIRKLDLSESAQDKKIEEFDKAESKLIDIMRLCEQQKADYEAEKQKKSQNKIDEERKRIEDKYKKIDEERQKEREKEDQERKRQKEKEDKERENLMKKEEEMKKQREKEDSSKPSPDRSSPDRPSPDRSSPDRPSPDRSSPDRPSPDRPSADKPSADKPSADKPSADKPSADKPSADKPSPDKPSPDKPSPDKPSPVRSADELFNRLDKDGSKGLSREEFKEIVDEDIPKKSRPMKEIFDDLDVDKKGKINKEQFEKIVEKGSLPKTEKDPKEIFDDLDIDKKGSINKEQFQKIEEKGLIPKTEKGAKEIFDELDVDKKGEIDFERFKKYPDKLPTKGPGEVFDELDKEKKGEIDFEKFKNYPSKGVINERVKGIDEIFDELDKDKDGNVTKEEFEKLPEKGKFTKGKTTDQIFDRLDKDKKGKINLNEFEKLGEIKDELILNKKSDKKPKPYHKIFKELDRNGDGLIDKKEFSDILKEGSLPTKMENDKIKKRDRLYQMRKQKQLEDEEKGLLTTITDIFDEKEEIFEDEYGPITHDDIKDVDRIIKKYNSMNDDYHELIDEYYEHKKSSGSKEERNIRLLVTKEKEINELKEIILAMKQTTNKLKDSCEKKIVAGKLVKSDQLTDEDVKSREAFEYFKGQVDKEFNFQNKKCSEKVKNFKDISSKKKEIVKEEIRDEVESDLKKELKKEVRKELKDKDKDKDKDKETKTIKKNRGKKRTPKRTPRRSSRRSPRKDNRSRRSRSRRRITAKKIRRRTINSKRRINKKK